MDMNELHGFLLFSDFFIFTCGSSFYFFQIFSFSLVRAPFFSHLSKGPPILVFSQGYSYLSIFILGELFWLSYEAVFLKKVKNFNFLFLLAFFRVFCFHVGFWIFFFLNFFSKWDFHFLLLPFCNFIIGFLIRFFKGIF